MSGPPASRRILNLGELDGVQIGALGDLDLVVGKDLVHARVRPTIAPSGITAPS